MIIAYTWYVVLKNSPLCRVTVEFVWKDITQSGLSSIIECYSNFPSQYKKRIAQLKETVRPYWSKISTVFIYLGIMREYDEEADFYDACENIEDEGICGGIDQNGNNAERLSSLNSQNPTQRILNKNAVLFGGGIQ